MKRMLAILLTVCMLLSMVPAVTAAEATNKCGENLTWEFDAAEGTLIIEGTGDMTAYGSANQIPWYANRAAIKTVEIAEGVTSVASFAFNNHSALTNVSLPASITSIGEKAFYGCTALLTLAVGSESAVEFGTQAFAACSELFAVTLGKGVTEVPSKTFQNCNKVVEIYYIGTSDEWEDVEIASSNGGLYGLDEEKIYCMETPATGESKDVIWTFNPLTFTLTISGEGAMKDYDDVTECGWYNYRTAVRTIVVEPGVTTIGAKAFRYLQNANTVQIPATVTAIHDEAFAYCKGLQDVYYGSSEGMWSAIELGSGNGYLTGAEIHYAGECEHTNTSVKYTANGDETHTAKTVCACGVVVETAEPEACTDEDGDLKCDVCEGDVAEKEEVCDGSTHPHAEYVYTVNKDYCTHSVALSCEECGAYLDMGEEPCVDEDGDDLCDRCAEGTPCVHEEYDSTTKLVCNEDNTHTETVTCSHCRMVISEETTACTDEDENNVCDVCEGVVEAIYWDLTNGVLTISGVGPMEDYNSFTGMPWAANRNNVTEIIIEDGVTHIGARSFYRCIYATKITIAASVKSIGDSAFYRCDALKSVDFGGEQDDWDALVAATGSNNEKLTSADITVYCRHLNTTSVVTPDNNYETHTVTTTCSDCGNVATSTVDCTESEEIYTKGENDKHTVTIKCTVCAQDLSVGSTACDYDVVNEDNGNGTHTTTRTCPDCGNVKVSTHACTGGSTVYVRSTDGKHVASVSCTVCGHVISSVEQTCALTETLKAGNDGTHSVTESCSECTYVKTVKVDCTAGERVCTKGANDKHTFTVKCTVCDQTLSEEELDCELKQVYTGNSDGTHTLTETCDDCGNVKTSTEDCTESEVIYVKGQNNKHSAVVKCTVCEQTLSTVEEDCVLVTTYTDNKDRTHTVTDTCTKCVAVTTAVKPCVDEANDKVCDICDADLTCNHNGSFTKGYVGNNDHYTHVPYMFCAICGEPVYNIYESEPCVDNDNNDICDLCGQDISCLHEEAYKKIRYEVNSDRTHKVIEYQVCEMEGCDGLDLTVETLDAAEACVDEDSDLLCDLCGYNLTCAHEEVTRTVTYLENYTHEVKFVCKECKNVTFSQIDKCVNHLGNDKKCDVCEGICAHNYETAYAQISNEEMHNQIKTCEWCKDVVTTKEACVDSDIHNGLCDLCDGTVVCTHEQKLTYTAGENGTHAEVKTCDTCAAKDSSCDACAVYWETVDVPCADGDDADYTCDDCKADFAAAAAVGTKAFATFEEARTAAQNGDTITVLKDITLAKALTFSGEEITIAGDNATITFVIEEADAITVCDGGKLTLGEGLTVKAETALLWAKDGEIVVDGAALEADTDYVAALADNGGVITIESGSIRSTNNTLKAKDGGMIVINDGVVECVEKTARWCTVWNAGGEVKINGGTVIGNNASDVLSAENGTVTITGGTVKNTATGDVFYKVNGTYVVSGGTFSAPVAEEFCAVGKAPVDNGDGTYGVGELKLEKFTVSGVNMTLGNELELNIMLPKATVDAYGKDLTATVTHHTYNAGDTKYTFNVADLPLYGNGRYYRISIRVAAAQMTDLVDVVVTDVKGNVYNDDFTASVLTYVTNNLDKQTDKVKTLLVDMVNYGAAAQDNFSYRQNLYANSTLTEEQKALATPAVTCADIRVKGDNYVGSNLSLEDQILLNFFFSGVSDEALADMYATVTFTGVLGNGVNETVAVEKMLGKYVGVAVDQIVLADAISPVTVTVYNADGTVYGSATDSVESYIARQNIDGSNALYTNIMKFAASALAYKQ